MARLIDADELKKAVEDFPNCYNGWSDTYDKAFIIGAIEEAPTIDIVRCKECKWAKANGTYQWCGRLDSTARIKPDDYCSYGEREGE